MEDNKTGMLHKRLKHSKRISFDDVNPLLQSFAAEVDFVFECDDISQLYRYAYTPQLLIEVK